MNPIYRTSTLVITAAGLFGVAAASSDRPHPFKVELGAYFSNFSSPGVSKDTGATFALGYTFTPNRNGSNPLGIELELRGSAFKVSDGTDSGTVSIGSWLLNFNFSSPDRKMFYGAHVGVGKGNVNVNGVTFEGDRKLVYGLQGGYNFTPQVYGAVRYTTCELEGLRGFSVGVGFRF